MSTFFVCGILYEKNALGSFVFLFLSWFINYKNTNLGLLNIELFTLGSLYRSYCELGFSLLIDRLRTLNRSSRNCFEMMLGCCGKGKENVKGEKNVYTNVCLFVFSDY